MTLPIPHLGFKCENCGKYFSSQGFKNHQKCCFRKSCKTDMATPQSKPSARFEFPKMLYSMLEECTFDKENCKIVSWQSHGLAFKVHNRVELEKILPRWFREKYESFLCLLEQWGFLKLSRGKDRGCWYHKKFYHVSTPFDAKKKYERVDKDDFIDSMPEYLDFRDQPNLELESTIDNRISPKKRKAELDILAGKESKTRKILVSHKNDFGPNKEETDRKPNGTKRYSIATLKECRYCHELFAPQGFLRHEESCRIASKRKKMNDSKSADDGGSDSNSDSYSASDDSDPLDMAKMNRSALSESDDDDDDESFQHQNKIKCRYCDKKYSKFGVKNHETKCKIRQQREGRKLLEDSDNDDSDEVSELEIEHESPPIRFPCKFCGSLFTKIGVQLHERACKLASNTNSNSMIGRNNKKGVNDTGNSINHRGEVLLDDSSVSSNDSVESGCKICGFDDDHANLLLCEGCDVELHTYCLNPPLQKVPIGDWFCDSCKSRMGKSKDELSELVRRVPPEMSNRFGEICFAKSAENAHWWPALIFDPRSFLHNSEVVDLARRNLGKRYLVFFFENQDAFAAVPKTWIMTWENAVEKKYDKGRSVRNASKTRKEQFEKAMELAGEAFEDDSCRDSESDDTEFEFPMESEIKGHSPSSQIPRVIGGNKATIFTYCPDFDWKAVRVAVLEEAEATSPLKYPSMFDPDIHKHISVKDKVRYQAQVTFEGKLLYVGLFPSLPKASFTVRLFKKKMEEAKLAFENRIIASDPRSASGSAADRKNKKATPANKFDSAESTSSLEIGFGSFTDKKPIWSKYRTVATAKAQAKALQPIIAPDKTERNMDSQNDKTDLQAQTKTADLTKTIDLTKTTDLPPLSDLEMDELLLNTPLCHYYILPLSQL